MTVRTTREEARYLRRVQQRAARVSRRIAATTQSRGGKVYMFAKSGREVMRMNLCRDGLMDLDFFTDPMIPF